MESKLHFSWTRGNLAALIPLWAAMMLALAISSGGRVKYPYPAQGEKPAWQEKINPNTASEASLQRLPGVGPVLAKEIVDYRQQHGPRAFTQPADLDRVKRIGPTIVQNATEFLTFDEDLKAEATQPSR